MLKYAKFIDNTNIELAPTNFEINDQIIINFNLNEDLMIEYGYKPVEVIECSDPYDSFYQVLGYYYKEFEDKIQQIYYIYEKDLNDVKLNLLQLITNWYNAEFQKLIPVDNFYIKLEWLNTYSTVYQALKFAEEEGIEIPKSEVIVATSPITFENIMINTSEELKPLYKTLILEYSEITPLRNDLLVKTEKATTLQQLLDIKNQLVV